MDDADMIELDCRHVPDIGVARHVDRLDRPQQGRKTRISGFWTLVSLTCEVLRLARCRLD